MKWILLALAVLGAAFAFFMTGNEPPATIGASGIDGKFSAIVHAVPHSRDRVTMDIYADFTCPACQRLEAEGLPRILATHGSRLTIRQHYLAGPATAPSAKILYDVAVAQGLGEQVAKALFAAKLAHGDDAANSPRVLEIARRFSLEKPFVAATRDGSGLAKLLAEWKRANGKVAFFPFVVFDSDIATDADVDNIVKILDSLLKRPDASTH